ncbi:hypothetical protein KRR40_32180 [Niabella defluvii]|nr:hypothetical protein KRR40_32180 [Niabella sp. I65]
MNYFYLNPQKERPLFINDNSDRKSVIDNIIKLRAALSGSSGIPEKNYLIT